MINFNKKDAVADTIKNVLKQEGVDVNDRTEDKLGGTVKTKKKDDVGPKGDFKSTKIKVTSEDVEQIDELKKSTVKSYIAKKTDQMHNKAGERMPSMNRIKKDMSSMQSAHDRNTGVKPTSEEAVEEELKGNQHKIDKNHNGKIDSQDFKILRGKKSLKKFKEENEQHSIIDQMINEVLSKDASAGDWIHDFVHSDNPKFAGKSKAERKKQALAAYYAKQRNEDVESVEEEWNKQDAVKRLKDLQKREKEAEKADKKFMQNRKQTKNEEAELEEGLGEKLKSGAKKFLDKVGGGSDEDQRKNLQKKMGIPQTGKMGMAKQNEEVEQIDEEMKTKTAYVPYVHTDRHGNGFGGFDVHYAKEADAKAHVDRHGHTEVNGKKGWVEKHEITKHPVHGNWVDANSMRRNSVHEETVEEGWDDMVKDAKERVKTGPKPSGGSGVKQGSRYGGGKQKEEPKEKVEEGKQPMDNVPFDPPYNTSSSPEVTDKSGAKHTPMSRVKHLARTAMKKVKKDLGSK